jgi:DNA mismatch repair ATPase MutS
LYDLLQWKNKNADKLKSWLDLIAEFETLNSFANFSYNNPGFTFPEINTEKQYRFESLGHPLLDPLKRVDNDVDFSLRPFIVLTGSNMSGKSTFLRAIAVNLVLGATGSVVCAKKASFHPMPLFVSMRLSDSLADSESYFYAEIKRLHEIMQHLENGAAFVLLDEILRGTNSEDKRNGTIGVLKKLIEYKAVGAIATHDLEVCNTIVEYPDYLSNQCFEVEIKNDNLFFDYKLKQGISQNKSASFLMKKMQIIS